MQDLYDLATLSEHVTFSLIATDIGGAAVFAWLGSSAAAGRLVRSLYKTGDGDLVQSLVRLCFEFFENVSFSPTWWDALNPQVQRVIRPFSVHRP